MVRIGSPETLHNNPEDGIIQRVLLANSEDAKGWQKAAYRTTTVCTVHRMLADGHVARIENIKNPCSRKAWKEETAYGQEVAHKTDLK